MPRIFMEIFFSALALEHCTSTITIPLGTTPESLAFWAGNPCGRFFCYTHHGKLLHF